MVKTIFFKEVFNCENVESLVLGLKERGGGASIFRLSPLPASATV